MTSIQRRNLEIYLRFREQPMTVSGLIWANRRIYYALLLPAYTAFGALVYAAYDLTGAAYVGVAFAVLILRDISFYRRSVAVWPMLREVFDWDKIEKLAASHEDSKA